MNGPLLTSPMQEYRTSARRRMLHQGMVIGIENHSPFGKNMQCAVVELNYGLKGLIYEDQFDRRKYSSLVGFLGHKIDFMVLDVTKLGQDDTKVNVFDEEKGIVLLSRVQAIDELQEEFWSTVELNHIVTGEVSGFENERIYIRIKGVICVLAIQDYEHDWTVSGKALVPLGTELTVKITFIDRDNHHVRVSRKELLEDPWSRIHEKYGVENFYTGIITSCVQNVGIFIKLAPGIESLAWFPPANKMPKDGILVGKRVSVRIKNINADKRRIGSKIVDFPYEI
ncbi:30S ribosomal protein S1 [Paenibacillus sp. MWE-103]|uniref:30S ribosomal protein S1 n=1 Tax=Paenibacillus artemisiicola TaxID=1172618 RepID=A0ABS3WBW8_9BACL|nr:hypothetical protein [Paenibacillus artemisiicola]MBO7745809.1 30S ribosomal protein S1 [Paenibacillus artemisiicola]